MAIHRYRFPPVNVAFVCFACRVKTTRSKYGGINQPAVLCPQCRRPCDNIGDRRPAPPRNRESAWQQMERDYRSLQQRILAAYQQWRHEARSATLAHLQWAQKLNLPDIIARDEFWLEKLDARGQCAVSTRLAGHGAGRGVAQRLGQAVSCRAASIDGQAV